MDVTYLNSFAPLPSQHYQPSLLSPLFAKCLCLFNTLQSCDINQMQVDTQKILQGPYVGTFRSVRRQLSQIIASFLRSIVSFPHPDHYVLGMSLVDGVIKRTWPRIKV